ncbi:MAG: FHA domain-containing protein [Bdellovibrionales bacterium]|nr:FHA domain-containing protein [Bdellovibrionales bacterium]
MSNNLDGKEIKSALLIFLEGENAGSEIRVNPPRELVFGRSEECDIFLSEKKISRRHCKIHVHNTEMILEDLGSTNGTLLNRKQVKGSHPLSEDDLIQVGTSLVKIIIETQNASVASDSPGFSEPRTKEDESIDLDEEFEGSSGVMEVPKEPSVSEDFNIGVMTREQNAQPDLSVPKVMVSEPEIRRPKPLSGDLSAMSVADLLQNLSQNSKSGTLILSSTVKGEITVLDGKVIGATTGQVYHRKALYRMLTWNKGDFELLPLPNNFRPSDIEHPIDDQVENLLMEGFQQFDELEKIRNKMPAPTAKLRIKPKLQAPLSRLHPKVLDVLQLILNEHFYQAVLDASIESDLETAKMVYYLLKKDYIEIIP